MPTTTGVIPRMRLRTTVSYFAFLVVSTLIILPFAQAQTGLAVVTNGTIGGNTKNVPFTSYYYAPGNWYTSCTSIGAYIHTPGRPEIVRNVFNWRSANPSSVTDKTPSNFCFYGVIASDGYTSGGYAAYLSHDSFQFVYRVRYDTTSADAKEKIHDDTGDTPVNMMILPDRYNTNYGEVIVAGTKNLHRYCKTNAGNGCTATAIADNWGRMSKYQYTGSCGGAPCTRSSASTRPIRLDTMYSGGVILWPTVTGRILVIRVTDTSATLSQTEVYAAAAGDIVSMVSTIENGVYFLYIASSSGIITQWNVATKRISNLGLITIGTGSFQAIYALSVDSTSSPPAVWVAAGDSATITTVARMRTSDITIIDEAPIVSSAGIGPIRLLFDDPSRNYMIGFTEASSSYPIYNYTFTRYNCAIHSCANCGFTDETYCRLCPSSNVCQASNAAGTCAATLTRGLCPSVSALTVTSGSVSGGTTVQILGANFYVPPSVPGTYKCQFGSTLVNPTAITASAVTCVTPSMPDGIASVALIFNGAPLPLADVAAPLQFSFYNCSVRTCDTCFAQSECTWCVRAGGCRSVSQCSSSFSGSPQLSFCPAVTGVSPISAHIDQSINIAIAATGLSAGENYFCQFDNLLPLIPATYSATGPSIICPSPTGSAAAFRTPSIWVGNVKHTVAPTSTTVDFYDCTLLNACFTCIRDHPACWYCGDPVNSCKLSGTACDMTTPTGSTSATSCPQIQSISPNKLHITDDVGAVVTVIITVDVNVAQAKCVWNGPGGAVEYSPNSGSTARTLLCPTPNPLTLGEWSVSIAQGGVLYTNPGYVSVYTCPTTVGTTCSACIDAINRPKCAFCLSSMRCDVNSALTCAVPTMKVLPPTSTCPTITATASSDTIAGGRNLTLSFPLNQTPSTSAGALICSFSINSVIVNSTAYVNGSQVNCLTPAVSSRAVGTVTLFSGDIPYGSSLSYEAYDCKFQLDGSLRRCSTCVTLPGCGWCGSECGPVVTCTSLNPICPLLQSATPTFAESSVAVLVNIQTNVQLPPASYECIFDGTVRTSASTSGATVSCASPTSGLSGVQTLAVGIQGAGLWADNTLDFEFVKCPSSVKDCGSSCFDFHPACGWCVDSDSCTGRTECEQNPGALWLSPGSSGGCTRLRSLYPSHMQSTLPRLNRTVDEEVSFTVENLPLAALATNVKKRGLTDIDCVFGPRSVPVSTVNTTDPARPVITCIAPQLTTQGVYSVYLSYRGVKFTEQPEFVVQDCYSITSCGLCSLSPNCGWCYGSSKCMTKSWCNLEPFTKFDKVCPVLRGPQPAVTDSVGGELIRVTGGPFLNSDGYSVVVGSDTLNATFVDENTLTFNAPPHNEITARTEFVVYLLFRGNIYAPETNLSLTYSPPAAIVVQPNPAPLIGGLVALAAFLLLAVALVFIIMKKKKVGLFYEIQLIEPNYEVVAIGNWLQPMYKPPKDNLEILAIKLLASDPSYLISLVATTASTEEDNNSRALCYVYCYHNKAVEFCSTLISNEVKANKFENTIFRNNSMASKFFKYYSKVVGLKYLFTNFARFIVELEQLSSRKTSGGKESSGSNSKSLLSMEMEVDPEKFGDQSVDMDSDANLLQLTFACQKVFGVIRGSTKDMPPEFTRVFQTIQASIMNKFQSEPAILKAVGGFLFLRFICPALTAPHAYGLLQQPPNSVTQRQLVLIGKVIQNLANMTMPGDKEEFMKQLNDFFIRNIPRMRQFYEEILKLDVDGRPPTEIMTISDTVRLNSLCHLWNHIHHNDKKMRAHYEEVGKEDPEQKNALIAIQNELMETYPKVCQKVEDKKSDKAKDKSKK